MASDYPGTVTAPTGVHLDNEFPIDELKRLVENDYAVRKTLGPNPHGSYTDLASRAAAQDSKITALGALGFRSIRAGRDATTPNSKIVMSAAAIALGGKVYENVSVAADYTVAGKNGFDNLAADAEDADTWLAGWIGLRPSTQELCGLLSKSFTTPILTHASLSGLFTDFRLVTAVRNNAAFNFKPYTQEDQWVQYEDGQDFSIVSNAGATDAADNTPSTTVTQAAFPPGTVRARLLCAVVAQAAGAIVLSVRRNGSPAATYKPVLAVGQSPATTVYNYVDVMLDANRQFQWQADVSPNANISAGVFFGPDGFWFPAGAAYTAP